LTSVEHQTAERFRELLPELASLDELLSPMDLRTLRRELERLAAETRFQADSGDPPVHVLDALEHPGPSYDGLWITGLTADRWPAAAAPDPFLPLDLQRSLGMPWASAAGELERARRATDRLLGAAGEVVVSWPALIEEAHTELSALVPSNLAEYAAAGGGRDYGEELYAARRIEEVEDPGPALAVGDDPLPGGARVAELQAKCPFRAFAELRLGARRLESPTPGIAPFIRGQIVHAAFERVWRALGSQERLKAIAPDDLSRLIDAAVDGACTALGLSKPRRLVALERAWLAKVIAAVLDVEKSRAPFRVADLEVTERCVIGTATLALKIDRIDELDAGGEFIIDYKTGKPSARRWLGKGRDLPQLPLYATARPNPPVGLAFAHVNLRAPGFVGMAADAAAAQGIHEPHKVRDPTGNVRSFAAQLADWREWLVRLVGDHVAGVARVDPISAETCRECALAALCRVGADAVAETENSDDE